MPFPETRLRRLRNSQKIRQLASETSLQVHQLIWPVFVVNGEGVREEIASMPGVYRYSVDQLVGEVKKLLPKGLANIMLFGVPRQKDSKASEAISNDSVVIRAIQALKDFQDELVIGTDVCLCAYTDHGHCGLIDSNQNILNDETLVHLSKMALAHACAGADMVAPSDMMDGRVGFIRKELSKAGFPNTLILSYAAKYASSFYGPFRDAAKSSPEFGDRKTYQMNPANVREALREIELDVQEGADMVMVKPALPYLDVITKAKENFNLPIAAYQVSGEYAMIKAAAKQGLFDEKGAALESLLSIKRAGADFILSYFTPQVLEWLDSR